MKKFITICITLVIAISFFGVSINALETSRPGIFYTQDQVDMSKKLKKEYNIDVVFLYYENSTVDISELKNMTLNYLSKNKLKNQYFVFAFNSKYYYYEWSSDLNDIFHSIDGTYIANSIYYDDNKNPLTISQIEDNYFSLLSHMLDNRIHHSYKYIVDQAGVLNAKQEKELNNKLTEFKEKNKCDLVVVITTGIDNGDWINDDRMTFADDYYDYHDYSKDGALLLINIGEFGIYSSGNSWISTSGSCIKSIDEDDISDIGSHLTPKLLKGSYYDAVALFPDLVDKKITTHFFKNVGAMALITFIFSIIAAFCYVGRLKRDLKTVEEASEANEYIQDNSLNIIRQYDYFLFSHVSKTEKEDHSSSHSSSSGSTHGGGGF